VCTPSALSVLDIDRVAPNIQAIQVAGEAPRLAVMLAWKSRVPKLYIGLGPTELTAHALCGEFDGENICIGFPASNVKAYIINPASGLETPVNVVGELWVSGANVCNGYLNRPELDERFTVDLMGSGLRCYKTGDLAKVS
jgi:non-ribosomal peptide synthetase component F